MVSEKWISAKGVFGIWPCSRVGPDDIQLFEEEQPLTKFHTLRQQTKKATGAPNLALADFIAPGDGPSDFVGCFAVCAGLGIESKLAEFDADLDDYSSILLKALADRLAEAAAEFLHKVIRKDYWAYAGAEDLDNIQLILENYQGIRPAPGYPACPDHLEKQTIFNLLKPEEIGMALTESLAMLPVASVSGYYFAHPQAKYFGLGKINEDQVKDYAKRKGMDLATAEKWLRPNLNYEA
jgi:5-methyltetrahydrofolate--homocysteine methyltransferase